MKIEFMLAWRSLASRPARSFTAILGIGLGIATVLSIQVVDHNTILTQEQGRPQTIQPDVEMRPVQSGFNEGGATPAALDEENDLAEYSAIFFHRVQMTGEEVAERQRQIQICGLGPNADTAFDAYEVDEGRGFSSPTARELVLPHRLADDLKISLGDSIEIGAITRIREGCRDGEIIRLESKQTPSPPQTFEVVGFVRPRNLGQRRILLAPFEAAAELFRESHFQPVFWGKLVEGAVFQDLRERLKSSFVVEKPKLALVGERIDQRAFRKSIRVTSVLSLLLGLFVIYNAFSMALVERVREIGLLRAIGLRRREIATAVIVEGAILAIAGAIAGVVLTVGVVALMKTLQITTLGQGKPLDILEVPWGITAGVLGLGSLFALFGMTAPLLRARHLSVIEALRAGRLALRSDPGFGLRIAVLIGIPVLLPLFYLMATPPLGERQDAVLHVVLKLAGIIAVFFFSVLVAPGILHRVVGLILWPFRLLLPVETPLAQAAIRGSRLRIMATLTGLTVVVASIFCIREVNQGFLREMSEFSDVAMSDRVFIQTKDIGKKRVERLEATPGVERIYSLSAEILSPFPIRGVHGDDAMAELDSLKSNEKLAAGFLAGDELILSQFLADSFGYRVGDEVRIPTFTGARSFRVGAIEDRFGYFPDDRNLALMEAQRMEELFCITDDEGTRYVAELTPDADRDTVVAALSAGLPSDRLLWIRSDRQIKAEYLGDRRRDFWVFDVILWLIASLATIGLLNSLAIALLERRREIGLLRTIGLTPRQVGKILLLESFAVGLLAGVLAAAMSIPLSKLSLDGVRIISQLGLRYEWTPYAIGLPIAAAVIIALLAGTWPAIRSGRLPLGALARYE